ncbi:MAG: 6-phosphogluconolactonase [Candidatus Saccharimonadales bacterium]
MQKLVESIAQPLRVGEKVLWLMSGGSGGRVSVDAAKQLQDIPLENLYVTLSDERYGPIGHPDENWQLLLNDGFSLPGATLYRPLTGQERDTTTKQFASWLENVLESVDYVVGIFGIGADGHTAGIKPGSDAVEATTLTASYDGDDYERITITPAFMQHVDEAVVQAFGQSKHAVIRQLLERGMSLNEQPAQILKSIPIVTFYSDYKEK